VRLAWFTPWPPERSGIAGRSAELVPHLAARGYGIDVFVDEGRVAVTRTSEGPPSAGQVRVQSAHDFVWRMARWQYDLPVYQIGNSRLHEFIWPYLFRWPGLAVLHDGRLHHARGRALLAHTREDDYRAEFAWNHPGVAADAAELAIAGFDGPYYYQWPMTRSVVDSARLVAAHSRGAVAEIAATWPHRPVEYIALGEGRTAAVSEPERRTTRHAAGLTNDAVVFGVFGRLSAERRLVQVLRAFATTHARVPQARLLLAGTSDPAIDVRALARSLGIADAVRLHAEPADDEFDRLIASVDVSLNLRWPTALETSGPWLRALAAARPTVVIDLAHLGHVATLDPRTWQPHAPAAPGAPDPIAVAIDILDEDHSLKLAMHRLASDEDLRARLGRAGRAYWEAAHTVEHMVDDYERVLGRAAASAAPELKRPAHFTPDPLAHAGRLLRAIDPGLMPDLHVQAVGAKEN
jgi:glycosyltransferase involved in cell wall biosynthesis